MIVRGNSRFLADGKPLTITIKLKGEDDIERGLLKINRHWLLEKIVLQINDFLADAVYPNGDERRASRR